MITLNKKFTGCLILLLAVLYTSGQVHPDIVGGGSINISQVPYQALLDVSGQDACGAVIISPSYVLTAGHCVVVQNTSTILPLTSFVFYAGITDRTMKTSGQSRTVDQIILNPNFVFHTATADIAILHLNTPLTFNANVGQIKIATQNDVNAGYTNDGVVAQVTGWGLTSTRGTQPNILQALNQAIVDNNTINPNNYTPAIVTAANIVTAGVVGQGTCAGDSGGPLTVAGSGGTRILAGLVDYGDNSGNCATANPNIYVRISSYTNFIVQNTISITGTQPCCAGFSTTYTLTGLAPLSGVTWTANSDFTPTSGTGINATITSQTAADLYGTLTYSYSTPQGGVLVSPISVANGATIWASLSNSGQNTLNTVNSVNPGQYTVWVYTAGATSFNWVFMGTGISWTPNGTGTSMTFNIGSGQSGTWQVKPVNRCTYSIRDLSFTTGYGRYSFDITQSGSNIIVTAKPPLGTSSSTAYTFNVELLTTQNSSLATTSASNRIASISIASLNPGNYFVRISKDTDTISVPITTL